MCSPSSAGVRGVRDVGRDVGALILLFPPTLMRCWMSASAQPWTRAGSPAASVAGRVAPLITGP